MNKSTFLLLSILMLINSISLYKTESPDLEEESMEEPYEETLGPEADEQNDQQEEQGNSVDRKDTLDGQTSPPKPESAPVVAPFNVDDTINLDTSCAHKTIDNASLIVHVDDTQSDLDGDLDTAASDLVGKDTNAASVNEAEDGKSLHGNSNSVDDNDQGEELDEDEEGELEDEEEEQMDLNKSASSKQGDENSATKESATVKDSVKTSAEKKSAAAKDKDASKGAGTTVAAVSTASTGTSGAGSKEGKEASKLSQEANTGSATNAQASSTAATATTVKAKRFVSTWVSGESRPTPLASVIG